MDFVQVRMEGSDTLHDLDQQADGNASLLACKAEA